MYTKIEAYLGQRIIDGAMDYATVVTARPANKAGIDAYLTEKGRTDLITA